MHRFQSRAVRAGTLLFLALSGAAFGFVKDSRPQYAAVSVITLAVAFGLFVAAELANTRDTGTAAAQVAAQAAAAAPGADGGQPEPDGPEGDDEGDGEDGEDLERCEVCGRTESRTTAGGRLELPEGWLSLEIDRRCAELLTRTYCSEEHMRLGLAGPLPAPELLRDESGDPWDVPRTAGDRLVDLAWMAGLLLVCGFLLLGCVLAVRFLFGLAVSAVS
ncbi:hypothetical protein ACFRAR_12005 [Kitasatospora sp. NPDC056651]|uniref:hypothetical protein n=1 Tax=Kitasatospora sp. NPDC056651 TaxID=3345892 RepID=UPI0036A6B414